MHRSAAQFGDIGGDGSCHTVYLQWHY